MADVIEVIVTRYRCSVCGRGWSSRKRAQAHAIDCLSDPAVRGCGTCKHDYLEEHGEYGRRGEHLCALDVKPEGDLCVRRCPSWESHSWLVDKAADA